MTAKFDELLHHCGDLGIDVQYEHLENVKHRGEWRWWSRTIALDLRLTAAQRVSVLAHELGHVVFGDECSTPAVERRAWEYAASLLVTPEEYRDAEAITGPHVGALAKELGVTVKLVEAWRRWWSKRGAVPAPRVVALPLRWIRGRRVWLCRWLRTGRFERETQGLKVRRSTN